MNNWLVVGKIVNTHGIRGEVRVISSTDFAEERYAIGSELMIKHPDEKEQTTVTVRHHRVHKQFDLLQFDGYESINDVEQFKGATLYVSKDALEELDEHEFYYHEIIGCTVLTENDEQIGKVKEIIQTGANDVWVVQRKHKEKDVLIPYIEEVVKEINTEEKLIRIHVMEGLLE